MLGAKTSSRLVVGQVDLLLDPILCQEWTEACRCSSCRVLLCWSTYRPQVTATGMRQQTGTSWSMVHINATDQ